MMSKRHSLTSYPEGVIAMIAANAKPLSSYSDYDSSGLEEKVGTGMLNIDRILDNFNNYEYFSVSNDTRHKDFVSEISINLQNGDRIRIALAWIVNSDKSVDEGIVTDYDLRIYRGTNMIDSSASGYNNIEFVDYTATETGTYTIKVYQYGEKKTSKTDFGAIAYNIS